MVKGIKLAPEFLLKLLVGVLPVGSEKDSTIRGSIDR